MTKWPDVWAVNFCVILLGMSVSPPSLAASSLNDFRWENRIVIIQIGKVSLGEFERDLKPQLSQLNDYRLIVFAVLDEEIKVYGDRIKESLDLELREGLVKQLAGKEVALIGFDGGVKRRYEWSDFSWEAIYSLIDTMPMRQAELRSRDL